MSTQPTCDLMTVTPPPQSDALLAAIVGSSDDAIISKDVNGRITSWNPAAERIFGYRADEVIGQPVTILFPPERVDEEDLILERIRKGERVEHFETEHVRKDGKRLEVSLTISPVRNSEGTIVGASKIARDVTERRRAERRLERNERLLADFFENATLGLHWVGPDGIILRANRAELKMLGYGEAEYVGRHIAEFHVDQPVIESILARLTAGETIEEEEARLRCKDGFIKHVLISSSGLWEEGKLVHTRCFTRDISAAKEAEARVQATLRELNDLKTAMDEHAIVAITDARGKISYANDKFCAISKYSRSELIGQDHRIINSGHHSKEFIQDLWTTIRSGRVWKGEIKNRAKDGTFYWVDTTIVPYVDEDGKPTQFVAIRADITDRKLAEEQLRESERRFRIVADAAPILMWMAGSGMKGDYFNKAWLDFTGNSLEEEVGDGWIRSIHPEDKGRCLEVFSAAVNNQEPFEIEYRLRHHTGEYRWVLDRGVPRFGPDGMFVGFVGGCVDIEFQKRAGERLERQVAERTAHLKETISFLEDLCYTIAHDLRSPLRAINGFTNILLSDYAPAFDAEGRDLAQRIARAATRMDTLILDLLKYARLSHMRISGEEVDLNVVFDEIKQDLAHEIESRKADIQVHPLPVVKAQRVLLKQILSNLVDNAFKFTRPGEAPRVEIGVEEHGKFTRVWVQDNGIGIEPEYRSRVFDVFQRLHPDSKRYPGTGVGLAIVKKAMERMGGRVSIAPDQSSGTRFNLDFPSRAKGNC